MQTICVVTCYSQPDYVRALVLRNALRRIPNYQVIVVKNHFVGALRYPEVAWRLLRVRIQHRPDVYLLTFRGYELLPIFLLLTIGKKRIFDELINLVEWVVYEHKKLSANSLPAKVLWVYYRFLLRRVDAVISDTRAHAHYSADLMRLPRDKFHVVHVGADETIFHPLPNIHQKPGFQVFYVGNMLPLHGWQYVLDAARLLADLPAVRFVIVGGKPIVREQIQLARKAGAHVSHEAWVPFSSLPKRVAESAIILAGPFGGTLQAGMVITSKTYQALAMGKPVIVGETANIPELKDRQNCLIVPQANAQALADTIRWAYAHPKTLQRIGASGRRAFEAHFTTAVVAEELDIVLAEM